eukprot:TRINITY_DN48204_c0_g1_i1.p1 TRINITY_DN48204_c0_g1~~TRINITY_DN48204_c0_g1_i1.p1  ORF type:complete len:197 (-),score=42.20 TRINITY_DN48204_c0_g1_i1:145-735(-)
MVSILAGRWLIQSADAGESMAVVSLEGEVSFVDDPETKLQLKASEGGDFLLTADGEDLCQVRLTEVDGTTALQLDGGDGQPPEIWKKSAPATVARRRQGAESSGRSIQRRFTKENPSKPAAEPLSTPDDIKKLVADTVQGNLQLNSAQLLEILSTGPHSFSEPDAAVIFKAVDSQGIGQVNFDDVVDFVFQGTRGP